MAWFKSNYKIVLAVILMIVASFGLGYLIRGEVKKSPIIIEKR
jgi:hypothetical protein